MEIDIQNLARLARIQVTAAEAKKLERDLESILGYVSVLEKAPVQATPEGTLDSSDLRNVFREDEDAYPARSFTEAILEEAPRTEKGYLVVKQILDK